MKSTAVWTGCILAALFCGPGTSAEIIMTLEQVGPNVVATASGTAYITDVTLRPAFVHAFISPNNAGLVLGGVGNSGAFFFALGPASFGSGSFVRPTTGTGARVGTGTAVLGPLVGPAVVVPLGYVSGTFLSGTATWDNTTLAALGVTSGTYTWTWGSGAHADKLKLFAGVPVTTPEPGPLGLLGTGLLGLAGMARRKFKRLT